MTNVVEEDKALAKLSQMEVEFTQHRARLSARAAEIHEKVGKGEYDLKGVGGLVVELFLELHDTGLSFQQELTRLVREEWAAEDDDDEEEAEDDGDEPADADVDSQLLPGDAAQLRRTTTEYHGMLTAMLQSPELSTPSPQRSELEKKQKDAEQSLDLVNEIEITDNETAPSN